MPGADDFASVLRAAQRGEERAFAVLYRRLNARILRYFASRAPGQAEDLAAETWMGAARNLATFEGDEASFRSWLFTIANRRLVQHWRESARRPPLEPSSEGEPAIADPEEVEESALQTIVAQEAARTIAGSLTREQAEVVLLRVLGGLGVEDVARVLGKRPGAVRALQHKAVRKLATTDFFLEAVTP